MPLGFSVQPLRLLSKAEHEGLLMRVPNPRYNGKPLLRLLECYVLWAIDRLPAGEASTLQAMTPKLQAIYGVQGDWHQVIASAVQLPANMPDLIRTEWARNTDIAQASRATLTPQNFAEMFVDQNLSE